MNETMLIKSIFSTIFLLIFISCSNKSNFKDEMILKVLPKNEIAMTDLGISLSNYIKSINQINYNETLSTLKNEDEKNSFKKRMIDFRDVFNNCVDKLNEFERVDENNKKNVMTELQDSKNELDTIWTYIVRNYKI